MVLATFTVVSLIALLICVTQNYGVTQRSYSVARYPKERLLMKTNFLNVTLAR